MTSSAALSRHTGTLFRPAAGLCVGPPCWLPRGRRVGISRRATEDWRDFRARLVQRERTSVTDEEAGGEERYGSGWAYQTDLLEQGSLILSVGGDYWSLRRQYFGKVVMLVISHTPQFSAALVLNRPTNLTTKDFGIQVSPQGLDPIREQILRLAGIEEEVDEWPVWFGGDCEGLEVAEGVEPKYFCLHTLPELADQSRKIIKGIFLISVEQAGSLVRQGKASKEDFMLFVGYTGWGPGQLEGELARGGAWVLGAADQGLLLGQPGDAPPSLVSRMQAVCSGQQQQRQVRDVASPVVGLGDGIHHWNELYKALRPAEFAGFDEEEEAHNDNMIRRWVELHLNTKHSNTKNVAVPPDQRFPAGTILRGSATHWVLGRPDVSWPSREHVDPWQVPGQYMHKAVLFLLRDWVAGGSASFVLLNGPRIGSLIDGRSVRFGGTEQCTSGSIVDIDGAGPIAGTIALPAGVLEKLLHSGAVTVAEGISVRTIFNDAALDVDRMWEAAGGKISSLSEVASALQGDRQQKKWYRELLGIDISNGLS